MCSIIDFLEPLGVSLLDATISGGVQAEYILREH